MTGTQTFLVFERKQAVYKDLVVNYMLVYTVTWVFFSSVSVKADLHKSNALKIDDNCMM